jgi:hypothetical protein
MQENIDPRKRPLLTPEQIARIRQISGTKRKKTPREQFESLFRSRH